MTFPELEQQIEARAVTVLLNAICEQYDIMTRLSVGDQVRIVNPAESIWRVLSLQIGPAHRAQS